MQQSLLDEKENAFLSQKLATIVTDLDIDIEHVASKNIGELFSASRVIEFLKRYEFRSLVPRDHQDAKKEIEKIASREISTMDELHSLLLNLQNETEIILATDTKGGIAISVAESLYCMDSQYLDIGPFLQFLATWKGTVLGYDLKDDLHNLDRSKKSPNKVQGQGVLF
jgi:hypothetical protein